MNTHQPLSVVGIVQALKDMYRPVPKRQQVRVAAPNALALLIRTKRQEALLSQHELSRRLGAEITYINQIESGRIIWPAGYFFGLAHHLNVTPKEIMLAAEEAQRQVYGTEDANGLAA